MRFKNHELKVKEKLVDTYIQEIRVIGVVLIIGAYFLMGVLSNILFGNFFLIYGIIIGIFLAYSVLCLILYTIKRVMEKRRLMYLPLSKEECKELNIHNLYDMLVFLNEFLRITDKEYCEVNMYQAIDIGRQFGIGYLNLVDNPEDFFIKRKSSIISCTYKRLDWIEFNKKLLESITLIETE